MSNNDFTRRIEAIKADIENAKGDFNEYNDYQIGVRQGFRFALEIIENHTRDMTPRTGKWIESDSVLVMGNSETDNFMSIPAKECSVCHKPHIRAYGMNYCPNCGAKMEGEQDADSD